MRTFLNYAFAATMCVFGVHEALAQPVSGCPAGQAMQSSDPSGKKITCVPLPDVSALQQMDATILSAVATEKAARESADQALSARIDAAAAEPDIVGRWAMTGSSTCLQSTTGFDANFTPNLAGGQTSSLSQLTGTVNAVRTFNANGTGHTLGVTHTLSHPQLMFRFGSAPTFGGNAGSASVSTIDMDFTWTIQSDGTLLIEDNNAIPQRFLLPTTRADWTVVVRDVPSFVGHISKDRRTIVLTHSTMQVETAQVTDGTGVPFAPSQRFCARDRVLTRLAD